MPVRVITIALLLAVGLLAGCGFQLRGDAQIDAQLNPLYLDASELDKRQQAQLRQTLQRAGAELTREPEGATRLWVRIGSPQSQKIAGSGRSDVELRRVSMDLRFRLSDAAGNLLLQDDISRVSQLELDTNNVLAHERQLDQLSQQLQRELIRVMLFQITHFR